jgi:hypothetical protein
MKKKILGLMHDKFSFPQMTSNSDGKTSGSGSMGVLVCIVGSFCFLLGAVDKLFIGKDVDLITQSIIFVGIGAALLGYRKSKDGSQVEIAKIENGADVEIAKLENGETEKQECTCPEKCNCPEKCTCGNCERCA